MSGVGAKFLREGKVPHTEGGDPYIEKFWIAKRTINSA